MRVTRFRALIMRAGVCAVVAVLCGLGVLRRAGARRRQPGLRGPRQARRAGDRQPVGLRRLLHRGRGRFRAQPSGPGQSGHRRRAAGRAGADCARRLFSAQRRAAARLRPLRGRAAARSARLPPPAQTYHRSWSAPRPIRSPRRSIRRPRRPNISVDVLATAMRPRWRRTVTEVATTAEADQAAALTSINFGLEGRPLRGENP